MTNPGFESSDLRFTASFDEWSSWGHLLNQKIMLSARFPHIAWESWCQNMSWRYVIRRIPIIFRFDQTTGEDQIDVLLYCNYVKLFCVCWLRLHGFYHLLKICHLNYCLTPNLEVHHHENHQYIFILFSIDLLCYGLIHWKQITKDQNNLIQEATTEFIGSAKAPVMGNIHYETTTYEPHTPKQRGKFYLLGVYLLQ